ARAEGEAAGVLEEPADDGADRDPVRDARYPRPQAADPADGEVDRNTRAGGAVERADDPRVHDGIHLREDGGGLSLARLLGLPADQLEQLLVETEGRHRKPLVAGPAREARQVVEELRGVVAEFRPRRQEAEIRVDLRRHAVVVPGPE